MNDLQRRALGRWRGILLTLGADPKCLTGKNCPCPFCGGRDRFRFVDKKGDGFWVCNQCGNGDGFEFLKRLRGTKDFSIVAKEVEAIIGKVPMVKRRTVDNEKRSAELNRLWSGAKLISLDDPAGRYLTSRGLIPPLTGTSLRWSQDAGAMLARVQTRDGKPITIQQTFINNRGQKLGRKTFWGDHPQGCAVQLSPPNNELLGIAEGVETAMSASTMFSVPVWAALDANHLKTWTPPKGVGWVMIFGDNDESYTGQAAAFELAHRLTCRLKLRVAVKFPKVKGTDFNDELRNGMAPRDEGEPLH